MKKQFQYMALFKLCVEEGGTPIWWWKAGVAEEGALFEGVPMELSTAQCKGCKWTKQKITDTRTHTHNSIKKCLC